MTATNMLMAGFFGVIPLAVSCAATLDIQGMIPFHPQGKPLEGLVITLDAGHGGFAHQPGYTGSARGVNSGVVENDLNMLVAAEVRHYLHEAGARVHLTRWDDRRVAPAAETERAQELGARTRVADDTRSHLFIAIHHNASARASADGVMILAWPTDSKGNDQPLERELANVLRDEIAKWVHQKEIFDTWNSEHPLVSGTDIPSACVEFGFLTNPDFDAWVNLPGAHRAEARGLYEGVVRMWTEHRAELEALRNRLFPGVAGEGTDALGSPGPRKADTDAPEPDVSRPVARTARQLWPFTHAPANEMEAQWLLDSYRRSVLDDFTFFHFDVSVRRNGHAWVLSGATNYPRLAAVAGELLKSAGLDNVRNEIEALPSPRLGAERFGVVKIPMAMTWGRPAEGRDVKTQLLLGERVFLLDQTSDGGYLLVQGGEGYCGWVRSEAVLKMDEAAFADWSDAHAATITRDTMVDDFRLPAGASLPIVSEPPAEGGPFTLRLPAGVRATKGETAVMVPADSVSVRPSGPGGPGMRAARTAAEYLTVPYVFGGRSRLGLDCSGLTGVAWAAAGLTLPRDANQQIRVGRVVATPYCLPDLSAGDLVFFCDDAGNVIHAGVSLGGKRFIHASPPEVQINSFDEKDPLYSDTWRKHFAFARRPME